MFSKPKTCDVVIMIAPLKEEILRFESLSKNHCSIYFPSSPRANFLILFAKFCTMLSTFWKVGEHSDETGSRWKSWEEVDNGLKKLGKMESKSKVERLYNLHEPSFRNMWRNGMYLRSFLEFRANLGLHLHHNLTIWGKYGVGLCM
jgi:hypothetical protein